VVVRRQSSLDRSDGGTKRGFPAPKGEKTHGEEGLGREGGSGDPAQDATAASAIAGDLAAQVALCSPHLGNAGPARGDVNTMGSRSTKTFEPCVDPSRLRPRDARGGGGPPFCRVRWLRTALSGSTIQRMGALPNDSRPPPMARIDQKDSKGFDVCKLGAISRLCLCTLLLRRKDDACGPGKHLRGYENIQGPLLYGNTIGLPAFRSFHHRENRQTN